MTNLKNPTLRNRTEGLLETADNFNELFKIGAELHDIGRLIQRMACHMKDLQDKVDGQAEELRRLQWREAKKLQRKFDGKSLPEIASLRWLANQFLFTKNPKNDIEKMQNCIHSYCSHGADKLEELLKALKEQDWIPVTERNPNKNGNYLVTVRSWDETASIDFEDVDHCNADGYWLHYHDSANKKKGRRVIAWKVIEPYIGESNGEEE